MAFIAKEESLMEWAHLVTEVELTSLNQIQNPDTTSLLLTKLDPDYFIPVISQFQDGISLTKLFSEIGKYYAKQIGTNIEQLMGDEINIYSTSSIEEIWLLVLGIAIKGRNRERNINTILRMRPQTQEELMRIISKLISKFGENVSVIDTSSLDPSQTRNTHSFNDTSIIMELTEENQQLREKLQQLSIQVSTLSEKNAVLKADMELKNKERRDIINVMIKDPISTKSGIYYERTGADSIVDFIKDLIAQVNYLGKELSRKEEKHQFFEDVNKDLKLAYTTVFMELQDIKKVRNESQVDLQEVEKKIEELRAENVEYAEREKDLISKISDLEQQKYYLKEIVQRLEAKKQISTESAEQATAIKRIQSQKQNLRNRDFEILQFDNIISEAPKFKQLEQKGESTIIQGNRQKTVRNQIDELKQPSQRNKLQREVSHLQKKLNSVVEQNASLMKINKILEKVVNEFTKESEHLISEYESQIEPLFQQFTTIIEWEQQKRKELEECNVKQEDSENKMRELLQKIKHKITGLESKQMEYQKMIKKLQIQRDQLLNIIKNWESKQQIAVPVPEKPQQAFSTFKMQLSVEKQSNQQPIIENSKLTEGSSSVEKVPAISIQGPQINFIPCRESPKHQDQSKEDTNFLQKLDDNFQKGKPGLNPNFAASIIMDDEEETSHRRQYSFMGNKRSSYQQNEFDLVEKTGNKLSTIGSYIGELIEEKEDDVNSEKLGESLEHVQIIDITQIEEQLSKIKDHYVGIASRNQKICQTILKRGKQPLGKQITLPKMVAEYENLAQQDKKQGFEQFTKSYTEEATKKAAEQIEMLKLRNENTALRSQALHLVKQRQSVEERLTYVYQQSSKSQTEKTKEELARLSTSIAEVRHVMAESQSGYVQLHDQLLNALGEGDRTEGQLREQVQHLKIEVKGRDHLIQKMKEEAMILLGAMLELRNG